MKGIPDMKKTIVRTLSILLALVALALSLAACASEDASEQGYVFKTPAGVELAIGASGSKAIAALGTAKSVTEQATCLDGEDGTEYIHAYDHFRITTIKTAKKDIVQGIELLDDSVKTPEGLYIGMTVDAAKTAMSGKGTPVERGDSFDYVKGNMKLHMIVRDGVVTGISYLEA